MRKIKRNDEVIVIAGKDKGKRGSVIKVLEGDRLLVAGVNMIKKHSKGNPAMGVAGGIIEKEAPVHVSNVAIYNPETGKADRVGVRDEGDKKVRFFKSNGNVLSS